MFVFLSARSELISSKHKMFKYINLIDKYVITSSTNFNGTITGASKAFCNISGYTKEELIGKPHNIVRHPDMPKTVGFGVSPIFKLNCRTII